MPQMAMEAAGVAAVTCSAGAIPARRTAPKLAARSWLYISITGDTIVALVASLLAFWVRFRTVFSKIGVIDQLTLRQYGAYIVLGTISLVATLAWMGIYNRGVLLRSRWISARIAKGVVIWSASFLAITLALKFHPSISRVYTALNGACALLALVAWRGVLGSILRHPSQCQALRQRTVFLGWNSEADRMWRTLIQDEASAYDVIGWVDNGQAPSEAPTTSAPRYLGSYDQLASVLNDSRVDMVILADMNGPREEVMAVANLCEREMVPFKVIPTCFQVFASGLHLETVAGTPVLGVDSLPLDNLVPVALKRAVDIAGALFGLMVSAPIVAAFGLMVWLESRGSIFYRQLRTGIRGKAFEIIKIRSMKLNAEQGKGAQWCVKDDPRRLRVGAFMRKWNIDELPQFWNVLKGEMSLVGPRPERPELISNFKHQIPHYNARHNAKPGMTGWAQIKGLRGDTDLNARIQCDLWYLENWSLLLDLQIMVLTFFKRDNAY